MIKEIMRSDIFKLKTNDTLKKAMDIMHEHKINGAAVVDFSGKLAGMIVKADIYRFLVEEGHYDTCPVEWVMTKKVVTVKSSESIIEASVRIRKNNIISMPVIDDDGIVQGMVSIEDILDYFIKKEG